MLLEIPWCFDGGPPLQIGRGGTQNQLIGRERNCLEATVWQHTDSEYGIVTVINHVDQFVRQCQVQ